MSGGCATGVPSLTHAIPGTWRSDPSGNPDARTGVSDEGTVVLSVEEVLRLNLDLARHITEGIVGLLSRFAPDSRPPPADEDRPALDFADRLRRRDVREVLYLPELEAEPRWPALWSENDSNHERVFVRVATERETVEYAEAVFNGSLVHWGAARANLEGQVAFEEMSADRHWSLKLETAETVVREMGLTPIPPAAMGLRFGPWSLRTLLDPRLHTLRIVGDEVSRLADAIRKTKGVRSPSQAYKTVLDVLRLGYDIGALAEALDGRTPESLVELNGWLAERNPPFAWTRAG